MGGGEPVSGGSAAAVFALLAGRAGTARLRLLAAQRRQEGHQLVLLVLRQAGEGRRRRGRVLERALDGTRQQLVPDVGQVRTGAVVAVLADLVTRQAAGLRDHEL